MSPPRLLCLLLIPCLISCQESPTTPISPRLALEVGPGLSEHLPHQLEGTDFVLTVRVTADQQPASGVEVHWYDGRIPTNLSTRLSLTDSLGIAKTIWHLPVLAENVPWAMYSVQSAVRGALDSPILYKLEVYRCTKGC
jgi:hypothetical protein